MRLVLGVIAVLMGTSILLWIAYNFLIEMQPEAKGRNPLGPLGFSLVLIVVGVKWITGKKPG